MYSGAIKVNKLLLHETGSYNLQYRRPYNTNLNGQTRNIIMERLNGATLYEPSLMGGIANQFISPVATPEKQIEMINGWNEHRMRFMMEIEYNHYAGGKITEVVLGYTDYTGVSIGGSIDYNMMFFVNSTMQVKSTYSVGPNGTQNSSQVIDSSHILVNNDFGGAYSPVRDQRMRPEDVYSTMARTQLSGVMANDVYDSRTTITNTPVKSRRSNASAANFMSQVLRGYSEAARVASFSTASTEVIDKARGNAAEGLIAKDPFLLNISNYTNNGITNRFTFNDLRQMDPNVENVTIAQLLSPTTKAVTHQAGQTSDWGGADLFTTTATILSQSIPSMLMDLALTRIVFKSTNRTIGSLPVTTLLDAQGFSSGDLSMALQVFVTRMETEILRDISFDNGMDFAIEMNVDLLGETWLSLSMNGEAAIDYVTPSFCDALLVPVITADSQRAVNLASDFELLATDLLDNYSQSHMPKTKNFMGSMGHSGI